MTIKYTHCTNDGRLARILCTDRANPTHPVVALVASTVDGSESFVYLTKDLHSSSYKGAPFLREYNPWEDVPVDTPVWVRYDALDGSYSPRHFAGYKDGLVQVWMDGLTSHSSAMRERVGFNVKVSYAPDKVLLENPNHA